MCFIFLLAPQAPGASAPPSAAAGAGHTSSEAGDQAMVDATGATGSAALPPAGTEPSPQPAASVASPTGVKTCVHAPTKWGHMLQALKCIWVVIREEWVSHKAHSTHSCTVPHVE